MSDPLMLTMAFPPCECPRCLPQREREERAAQAELRRWLDREHPHGSTAEDTSTGSAPSES